jgi:formamidopyrimidine-DNA glycosylase
MSTVAEGPSIHLAAEQLQPFIGRRVCRVEGNSRIGIERFHGQVLREVFAWGKHLVFQFHGFALRVHFMLWGTFAATVKGASVTGDYRRSGRRGSRNMIHNGSGSSAAAMPVHATSPTRTGLGGFVTRPFWNAGTCLSR